LKAIFGEHKNVQYLDKPTVKFIGATSDFRTNTRDTNISKCIMPYRMLAIGWNGDCMPCCFDADMSQVVGNCNTMKIDEIWEGKLASYMRIKLKNNDVGDGDMPACKNCDQALVPGLSIP
jgi:radical SAM protein with 4Fe4S-binding SPASM domain